MAVKESDYSKNTCRQGSFDKKIDSENIPDDHYLYFDLYSLQRHRQGLVVRQLKIIEKKNDPSSWKKKFLDSGGQ